MVLGVISKDDATEITVSQKQVVEVCSSSEGPISVINLHLLVVRQCLCEPLLGTSSCAKSKDIFLYQTNS